MSEVGVVIVPAVSVDFGFCGVDDHILVGIGCGRFGVWNGESGICAKLELWASEDDLQSVVDAIVVTRDGFAKGRGACLEVVLGGPVAERIQAELRNEEELVAILKNRLVDLLRNFRQDTYVVRQTNYWYARRSHMYGAS